MKRIDYKNKKCALRRVTFSVALLVAILAVGYPVAGAGPDISDIPLDTMEQTAPGMIMFVIDDSNSMDWSIMCSPDDETDGLFNGKHYIFKNPGDDIYSDYNDNLEDEAEARMMWMSQWAGYNGMYYDPDTIYTPWPTKSDADPNTPRSDPMNDSHTLDMTLMWHEWEGEGTETVVGIHDAGFSQSGSWGEYSYYLYSNSDNQDYTATWTLSVDTSKTYNVYARWTSNSNRSNAVHYRTYNGTVEIEDKSVDQSSNGGDWISIASGVQFPSGNAKVQINQHADRYELSADAVKFVAIDNGNAVSNIARRHYYIKGTDGLVYLVNLLADVIEYYRVNLDDADDNREVVTEEKLIRLTSEEAGTAGIVSGRTYAEECQNFANWYQFYRRRELTAKNAIARVIDSISDVYIGLIFINSDGEDTRALPVRFNDNGTIVDESATLLNLLYEYDRHGGTKLRKTFEKAGNFYSGTYLKPADADLPNHTSSASFPYFKEDDGGACQMAFTVLFSDGYYNGEDDRTDIGNTDGDGNTDFDGEPFTDGSSNTLADFAMYYYENDLNPNLSDHVSTSQADTAGHQHMVTHTVAFGLTGTLNPEDYEGCPQDPERCPSWPYLDPDTHWSDHTYDKEEIDDMFHAAVNGRGRYMSAGSIRELNDALAKLQEDIENRLGSASGLSSSSIQRTEGTKIFQGTYNTGNWSGEISAYPLNAATGDVNSATWHAGTNMPDWDNRNILSYKEGSGIQFTVGNLSDTQKGQLEADAPGTAEQIVNFIRGDQSNSTLRYRNDHLIGDIIHSAPTYFKGGSGGAGTVYVGANDGMLHAVNANTGVELFAYVPGLVYDHLGELANPGYSHKYYVDGTPRVVNANGMVNADGDGIHLLVCGLNKGGKGYFALDVNDPTAMTVSNVLWEFTDAANDSGNDMGYSFSRPVIVKTENDGWVVIFGNGYDSVNGEAVLYVLVLYDDGTIKEIKKIRTGATGANGLSEPAVIDLNSDGHPDFIYAGDLNGNMWKFDTRGDVSTWNVYHQYGGSPMPMITVKNSSGQVQPITNTPEAMMGCTTTNHGQGLMVFFGTGRYLNHDDLVDTTVQSLYGIWDWGLIWEASDDIDTARGKFLGTLGTDRSLTQLGLGDDVGLLEKQVSLETFGTSAWYTVNDEAPIWYDPWAGAVEGNMGWVIDLPDQGERILEQPIVRSGVVIAVSTTPSSSPCDAGGNSTIWALDACTGGNPTKPFWDVDGDGDVDSADMINGNPPAGKKYDIFIPKVLIMDNIMYYPNIDNDPDNPIDQEDVAPDPVGMFYWRVLER